MDVERGLQDSNLTTNVSYYNNHQVTHYVYVSYLASRSFCESTFTDPAITTVVALTLAGRYIMYEELALVCLLMLARMLAQLAALQ